MVRVSKEKPTLKGADQGKNSESLQGGRKSVAFCFRLVKVTERCVCDAEYIFLSFYLKLFEFWRISDFKSRSCCGEGLRFFFVGKIFNFCQHLTSEFSNLVLAAEIAGA